MLHDKLKNDYDTELLPAVMSHQDISSFIDSGTFVYFDEFTLYNVAHVANLTLLFIHIYYLHSYSEARNVQTTMYTTLKFVGILQTPCPALQCRMQQQGKNPSNPG